MSARLIVSATTARRLGIRTKGGSRGDRKRPGRRGGRPDHELHRPRSSARPARRCRAPARRTSRSRSWSTAPAPPPAAPPAGSRSAARLVAVRRPLLLATLALAIACPTASAAPIVAPCAGTTGDTAGLIAAINQANTAPGPDTVVLGQGCTYTFLQQATAGTATTRCHRSPATSRSRAMARPSTARRASSANFRFFFVGADPTRPETLNYVTPGAGSLTIRDLTLKDGRARGGSRLWRRRGLDWAGRSSTWARWDRARTLVGNSAVGGAGDGTLGGDLRRRHGVSVELRQWRRHGLA